MLDDGLNWVEQLGDQKEDGNKEFLLNQVISLLFTLRRQPIFILCEVVSNGYEWERV